jgi:hypothetical protein
MSYFLDIGSITHRSPRTGRAAERAALTIYKALQARQDDFVQPGGGSADAPARTPRKRRTTSRKPSSDGGEDSESDDPALADLVSTLIESIAALSKPTIPVEHDLWDITTIASYLKRSVSVVRERIVCHPSFPAAIRLPNALGQRMQPLWPAQHVINWTMSHQERKR